MSTVRFWRSSSTVPKSTDGLRSSRNHAVISRSSLYSRTYGVSIRAVTFQSMYRTSSPGWYSRSAARSTPVAVEQAPVVALEQAVQPADDLPVEALEDALRR